MREAVASLVTFAPTPGLADAPPDLPDTTAVEAQLRSLTATASAGSMTAGMMPPGTPPSGTPQGPVRADATVVEVRRQRRALERQGVIDTQLWWLGRMVATPAPLQEKLTLFWHGHFATSALQKDVGARDIVAQNALFRAFAAGDVRELTQRVATDRAMLKYLDNVHNDALHPNENFARELMELFTLGIGNYTEADVREAARAWTGLRIRRDTGVVYLNERLHDSGLKTFLDHTGNFDGRDIVNIIFAQPAASRWFAAKLLTFFVYAEPEPELVDALAAEIRRYGFVLAPVLATLFSSNVFYSDRAYRALVKSPVEFVVGTYRLFGITQINPATLGALQRMSQVLFSPPNVKGWPGGATWLNSATVLARENFTNALMTAKAIDGASNWLLAGGPSSATDATRTIVDAIVQGDASQASIRKLQDYLGGADAAALGALSGENFDQRMRGAAYLAMAMPAYQLA